MSIEITSFLNQEQQNIQKYEFIDAMRGIAIIGVVLVHASRQVAPSDDTLRTLMNAGALGVQLFFIVSTLTLCLSWESRSRHEISPVRYFMIRRFFRIAPMFYVAILLYLAVYGFAPAYWSPNGIQWWFVPTTMLFLHGLHPETINSVVPGGWSIAVEMGFYAILAVSLPRIQSAWSGIVFLVVSLFLFWLNKTFVFYLFSYPEQQQYLVRNFGRFNLFSQLPVFAFGIFTYQIFRAGYTRKQITMSGSMLFVPLLFVLFASLFWPIPQLPSHLVAGGLFAVSALLLAYWPSRILVNWVTVTLGRLSFSIFLLHFAVLAGFSKFGISGFFPESNMSSVLHFLCILLVTTVVSVFSYRYIEQRGIACGACLIKRLEHST